MNEWEQEKQKKNVHDLFKYGCPIFLMTTLEQLILDSRGVESFYLLRFFFLYPLLVCTYTIIYSRYSRSGPSATKRYNTDMNVNTSLKETPQSFHGTYIYSNYRPSTTQNSNIDKVATDCGVGCMMFQLRLANQLAVEFANFTCCPVTNIGKNRVSVRKLAVIVELNVR